MLTYINEESDVWRILFDAIASRWKKYRGSPAKTLRRRSILATGSSLNAAFAPVISLSAAVSLSILRPYAASQYENSDPQADMVIAISQSGKSATTGDA